MPFNQVWPEIADSLRPRIDRVMKQEEGTWDEGLLLFLERSGFPEETYHTFSYSPIPDDNGAVGGLLSVVAEETNRVISERRMLNLRELATALGGAKAGVSRGADDYLVKPPTPEQLLELASAFKLWWLKQNKVVGDIPPA